MPKSQVNTYTANDLEVVFTGADGTTSKTDLVPADFHATVVSRQIREGDGLFIQTRMSVA